jgi:hypothetical protein
VNSRNNAAEAGLVHSTQVLLCKHLYRMDSDSGLASASRSLAGQATPAEIAARGAVVGEVDGWPDSDFCCREKAPLDP